MKMKILFDLDGTVADLYGVSNWLECLRNEIPIYRELKPLVDMEQLSFIAEILQNKGVEIGVVTWLSKNASADYELITAMEKWHWCKEFMPFIDFFEAQPYGTPKQTNFHHTQCILIDDNEEVRKDFETPHRRKTFDANLDIIEFLTDLANSL
jgi:hypothetical protein